jgi:hypothetical protein
MADLSDAHRQIRLLTARIAAAERAAGMTADDTATAERSMERHVRERQKAWGVSVADETLVAFRLSALHSRLRDAEGYRVARKLTRA